LLESGQRHRLVREYQSGAVGIAEAAVGSRFAFTAQFLGRALRYTYEVVDHGPGIQRNPHCGRIIPQSRDQPGNSPARSDWMTATLSVCVCRFGASLYNSMVSMPVSRFS
jgi:hypothetical protein